MPVMTKKNKRIKAHPEPAFLPQAPESKLTPSSWSGLLLGLMMFMAPALGVPGQEMLQDTLKSIIIGMMALLTAGAHFWQQRARSDSYFWHRLIWLPLTLLAYALLSMVWAHTYLAGVEASRWFVFTLILWLGMNCSLQDIERRILPGIHWGLSVASIWTALQFWLDFDLFPQGPNPASTFINRNFFAEYAICALPFSIYLLTRAKPDRRAFWLAATSGLNLVALMMTGTRSALIALLILVLVLPVTLIKWRDKFAFFQWPSRIGISIGFIFLVTLLGLGSVATANDKLLAEFGPASPIERATNRTLSVARAEEYASGSFSIRSSMWQATGKMIAAHPLTGVGAGGWEVHIPSYQSEDSQVEADYYAHNEFLQILAEYGLAAWLFLGLLLAYLLYSTRKTWLDRSPNGRQVAPLRAFALSSLLMLMVVSNAGFPWRMAATGALFALTLSMMAASDAKLGYGGQILVATGQWTLQKIRIAVVLTTVFLLIGIYICQRATRSELTLIQSVKLALTISKSGKPLHPYWNDTKQEMLKLVKEGIALNPHYRKLTPMVADELAAWGDWPNALWIWQSVLASRPQVVAIMTNVARAYLSAGDLPNAQLYLEKAQQIQPNALSVKTLQVTILGQSGNMALAREQAKALLAQGQVDYNLFYTAYDIGERTKDAPMMIQALRLRILHFPKSAIEGWISIGNIYDKEPGVQDKSAALAAFRQAVATTPRKGRNVTMNKIPPAYREQIDAAQP